MSPGEPLVDQHAGRRTTGSLARAQILLQTIGQHARFGMHLSWTQLVVARHIREPALEDGGVDAFAVALLEGVGKHRNGLCRHACLAGRGVSPQRKQGGFMPSALDGIGEFESVGNSLIDQRVMQLLAFWPPVFGLCQIVPALPPERRKCTDGMHFIRSLGLDHGAGFFCNGRPARLFFPT